MAGGTEGGSTTSVRLETLKRFALALAAAAPRDAALTAALLVALSVVEGLGLVMLVPLLELVGVSAGGAAAQAAASPLARVFASVGVVPTLGSVLLAYVGIVIVQSVLQRQQTIVSAAVRQRTEAVLRMRLYRAVGAADWQFVARSRMSEFSHVLAGELDRVGTAAHDLVELVVTVAVVAVYIAIAVSVSPAITALVLMCGSVLALVVRHRLGDAHQLGAQMTDARARLHAALTDHLASIKTAKSYGALTRQDQAFEQVTMAVRGANMRAIRGFAGLRQRTVVGSALVLVTTIYVARSVLAVPTAHLLMLLYLFARLMPRLTGLIERGQTMMTMLPSFEVYEKLVAQCVAAAEPAARSARSISFDRAIEFDAVTFRYGPDAARSAVSGLSFSIEAGQTTAIVGPSGAGKSTIADLLLGLLTPTSGEIRVDGQRLDSDSLASWRQQVGYVHQDSFLFHDTVRANLLWASPQASEQDLDSVLRMAGAHDFVSGLSAGLETVVGDRGVRLSGGERQRLALARALLRRPRLLVLDEATSALDAGNEGRILEAIDALRHQMTIVMITHRLAAIRGAEVIHVVEAGQLRESGSWVQLLEREGGRLRQLWLAQDDSVRQNVSMNGVLDTVVS